MEIKDIKPGHALYLKCWARSVFGRDNQPDQVRVGVIGVYGPMYMDVRADQLIRPIHNPEPEPETQEDDPDDLEWLEKLLLDLEREAYGQGLEMDGLPGETQRFMSREKLIIAARKKIIDDVRERVKDARSG